MEKIEIIARRILGWKMNRVNKWFDPEKGVFIENFNPIKNADHAQLIVERFQKFGIKYSVKGNYEVCFNQFIGKGDTLAEAITNAAYIIAENNPVPDEWL